MRDGAEHRRDDGDVPSELLIWFSPAFPTGAFAYSQGLETAVSMRIVSDRESLRRWLTANVTHGGIGNELKLVSLVMQARDPAAIRGIAELAAAMQPSAERAQEAAILGASFREAVLAGWPELARAYHDIAAEPVLAISVGIAARARALPIEATLRAYATGCLATAISAAIRLSVIGQFDGVRLQAGLGETIEAAVTTASAATADDLGTAAFAADIASMNHEIQTVRLFRS